MGEFWGFLWVMLALKIPLALLLWIVWWAIHSEPEPVTGDENDGGIGHRPHGPRRPPSPRRRGPHGDPVLPAPPRTRTPATATARDPARPSR
ncbi:MAG TPA: hypothetical protein VGW75_15590 [Solirubrobacteraceae bacterium]|nr:hypothetical protein [Solirubrobacteraceae bacterium]